MTEVLDSLEMAKERGSVEETQVVDAFESNVLKEFGSIPLPPKNYFAPGIYMREVLMLAGEIIVGHLHKTNHFNIVLSGRAEVSMNGVIHEIKGGDVFESGVNVRKVLHILEDMRWITVHPNENNTENVKELEEKLIQKSDSYKGYEDFVKLTSKQEDVCHLDL